MKGKNVSGKERIEIFKELCKDLGLKLTPQRLGIFHMLAVSGNHPSAEDVYKRVRSRIPSISFDTVYRALNLFEQRGIIARVQHLDDRSRYDSNLTPHPHLICIKCKKIQDFFWPDFDRMAIPEETKEWGLIKNKHLELRGICRECLQNER